MANELTDGSFADSALPGLTNPLTAQGTLPSPLGVQVASNDPSVTQYIAQRAISLGIDPGIALKVAGHEGLPGFSPNSPDSGGDGGSSFGPFQLHYGGINPSMSHPGLGDDFTKSTGLNAKDPKTWKQQVDFALQHAKQNGWGAWMGAKAEGVTGYAGINGQPGPSSGGGTGGAVQSPSTGMGLSPNSPLAGQDPKLALAAIAAMYPQHKITPIDYDPWKLVPKLS